MKPLGLMAKALAKELGAAQPDHGDSEGSKIHHSDMAIRLGTFFQNVGGIPAELTNDLRLRNAEEALPGWMVVRAKG